MTQQRLNTNDYYSSSDLALVCAISLWYPIEAIDKSDPHRAIFLFKRNENLDQLIESYWRGELKIDPRIYFQELKIIKTRLYGEG